MLATTFLPLYRSYKQHEDGNLILLILRKKALRHHHVKAR